jgi:hypothetical protein
VLVVLAAAAVLIVRRSGRPAAERKLWPGADPAQVQAISLTGPRGRVELVKKDLQWSMSVPVAYPVQPNLLQSFLGKLSDAVLAGPLTESPAKHSLFGLDSKSAVHLELRGGKPLDFLGGKPAPDYESVYVRVGPGPAVYEARGLSPYDLDRSSMDWLSKTVVQIPPDSLQAVVVKSTVTLSLVGGPGGLWRLGDKGMSISTAPGSPMNVIQGTLNDLEADQMLLPPFPARKARPNLEIQVRWSEKGKSRETVLLAYPEKDGMVPVEKSGEDRVRFHLYRWRLDAFRKPASEFR